MYTLSIQYRCPDSKKSLFAEYLTERYPAAIVSIGHNQSPCYTTVQGLRLEDLVLGFMDGITVLSIRITQD
jgi:O-phosphoseryl-tRNA(Cys) synthetase